MGSVLGALSLAALVARADRPDRPDAGVRLHDAGRAVDASASAPLDSGQVHWEALPPHPSGLPRSVVALLDAGASHSDAHADRSSRVVDDTCPEDLVAIDDEGHCCLAGQQWREARCTGAPTACGPASVLGREDGGVQCVARGCPSGTVRGADGVHCCVEGQSFSAREQRCTGAVATCPVGTTRDERAGGVECVWAQRTERTAAPRVQPGMQWIAGGAFEMGARGSGRFVRLSPYWMDRTEVTAAQYARCVSVQGCAALSDPYGVMRDGQRPAVNVTFAMARRFCAWRAARLPTESEWEFAARGSDGRMFPWGDRAPECALAQGQGCGIAARPAGSLPLGASVWGVLDLAGNVAEWVLDRAGALRAGVFLDPRGASEGAQRVVRGGGFDSDFAAMRAIARVSLGPQEARSTLGFRCARSE